MTLDDYLEDIETCQAKIKELQDKIQTTAREMIEELHPLKIGDTVEVNGVCYTGQKMRVTHRFYDSYYKEWKAKGSIIKKDGTPGLMRGEWHSDKINIIP